MMNAEAAVRLIRRYLLSGDEVLEVEVFPDAVTVRTKWKDLVAHRPHPPLAIEAEPWVTDIVEVTREDLVTEGREVSDVFVLSHEEDEFHLNDAAHVAVLARKLRDGMAPEALAEVLVRYHPWTSAQVGLVRRAEDLTEEFPGVELPPVTPPTLAQSGEDFVLTFFSWIQYSSSLGGVPLLRVLEWIVTIPPFGPATWQRIDVVRDIPLPWAGSED